ncbi:tRNA (adenosine(37)-N6)-threonylcarbamoyltransferase complex dimerization subunit type 1 TsaB [Rhodococcoides trifolii]|uniref:tRNA (Adenosine(37)-N6)-threonylcarbamoyltransferase complex dimerization subunit type 1 TsaB n=1 Tax=Rhodococcoides trifolii TaxID=908250 RepID=A0A917LCM5_9NOCA|nr:tRNA (adenosine(37)-N6)-threonylcarbamoyltransferase complex dimerization subunit type 1 TsaB [Rhodococcus trifolii]GGG13930.1 tRNA (adenosine(37)-N6)-threonylcarbamoyltransferase complex dimerization subunit type 1 TsaB [Rhodococcus trifolii]
MLVLAVDTSTPAVTAGLVLLDDGGPHTITSRLTVDARLHAEVLTPHILDCLRETEHTAADLDAVVVGTGPGPFTGLRVGMATAAAFADALHIPVHGVDSLDAIAEGVQGHRNLLVVTDARRKEVYWARFDGTGRTSGPHVGAPSTVDTSGCDAVAGSPQHVDLFDLPVEPVESPSPRSLVLLAADALLRGDTPEPLVPQYLRRPDAVAMADRKR